MKRSKPIIPAIILAMCVVTPVIYLSSIQRPRPGAGNPPTGRYPEESLPVLPAAKAEEHVFSQGEPAKHLPDRELFASSWQTSPRVEISGFSDWTRSYLDAESGKRATMVAEGTRLAKVRRGTMAGLIESDPREAIASTLPVLVRNKLPQEIQDLLEERVSDHGDLFRVMGIGGPGSNAVVPTVEQAVIGRRVLQAHRYGDRALSASMKDVSIHGIALDGHLAVLDSPLRKLEAGETAAETSEVCVITGGTTVVPEDEKKEEVETTTMLVGNHGYTMCCPFCSEDFETRMERYERQAMSAQQSVDAIAAGSTTPRALSSSGVSGSADYPGKPPYGLTHGTNTMIMMRVDFPDHPSNRFSEAELKGNIDDWGGVNFMVERYSNNQSHVASPTVTPILRMPHDTTYYNSGNYWGDILNDARDAAFAQGYNPDTFSCRVIIHDVVLKDSGAAGWGGGGAIWCNNNVDKRLLIHEYGHVFWLPHANSWTSSDGNPLSDTRGHVEYGDASDPMGNAWGTSPFSDFNAYYKNLLGWVPDSAVVPVSHSGTYRINQFDGATDFTKPVALKITRDNGLDLWVMFRGDGVPQGDYNAGAYIIGVNGERFGDSHVIDMNNPSWDSANAPLAQGQTWTDAASGITLTTAGRMMTDWPHHMYVKVDLGPNYVHGYRALVNGGIYAFRNKSFSQFLNVPGNSQSTGVEPGIAAYTGNAEQQWLAQRNSDGTYSFKHNGSTDLFLDVFNNGGGNYEEIIQWTWNGGDSQRWDVLSSWDGYLKMRHRGTNQLLTADTGGGNVGDVIQYDDFSGEEQKWEPYLVGINDGVYRMAPRHAQTLSMALRQRSGSIGTQVEQQFWASGDWQRWSMQNLGNGQFRIFPANNPGVSLSIAGGSTASGAKVVLESYTGASSQKFTFTATGMGFVKLCPVHAPSMSLEVNSAGTGSGADVQQAPYTGANSQQWRFIDSNL